MSKSYRIERLNETIKEFLGELLLHQVKDPRVGLVTITSVRYDLDVREVQTNFECGIGVSGFNDLQEGDVIEAFLVEEKARVV